MGKLVMKDDRFGRERDGIWRVTDNRYEAEDY